MTMQYDYDVIVVGARVAGSPTAMLLARYVHRVLLIDRVSMPADTVSTHALLRTGVLQLTRWGVVGRAVAGAPAIGGVTLGFGAERIAFDIKEEFGIDSLYAPRRFHLDGVLLEAAIEDGVEFSGGNRMIGLHRDDDDRVAGVIVKGTSGPMTITARHVIGADGVESRVASLVGAVEYRSHPPLNAVHYAYFEGIDNDGFWFQFTPGVNAGLIPTHDGATCVFVARPGGEARAFRADPDAEFRRLLGAAGADLAELVDAGARVTPFRGTTGLPGLIRRPWGRGWSLVGDAGYTKDPISAHGISDALRDAELCARAVDRALRHPAEEDEAMARYQRLRDLLSMGMFEESQALAGYGWTAEEASARMRAISAAVRRECEVMATLTDQPATTGA